MTPRRLAFSGVVIALYVALTAMLAPISFGLIQVRFTTGLYALAWRFPFLVLPLALANSLANYFGGLGPVDIAGGFVAGLLTSYAVSRMPRWAAPLPIAVVVPLVVSTYLAALFDQPFFVVLLYITAGQAIAAATAGYLVLKLSERIPDDALRG